MSDPRKTATGDEAALSDNIEVDSYIQHLLDGTASDSVYGLVLVAAWQPEELQQQYADFTHTIQEVDKSMYMYPWDYLHCTVATLISFKTGGIETEPVSTQEAYGQKWADAIRKALEDAVTSGSLPHSFDMTANQPFISKAAAAFRYENLGGEIQAIRGLVENAKRNIDNDATIKDELPQITSTFKVPGIIHSTIARFSSALADHNTFTDIAKDFQEAAKSWDPTPVHVNRLYIVKEDAAYMHLPKKSRQIVAEFRLPDEESK